MNIFLDTNIIIKTYLQWIQNSKKLDHSLIYDYRKYFSFIISEFVIAEGHEVAERLSGQYTPSNFQEFIGYLEIYVGVSHSHEQKFEHYVKDIDDSQILQDAYQHKAILLISQNIQDFLIEDIKRDFSVDVINIGGLVEMIRNQS